MDPCFHYIAACEAAMERMNRRTNKVIMHRVIQPHEPGRQKIDSCGNMTQAVQDFPGTVLP